MCRFNYPKPISHSTVFAKPCDIENESPAQKTARLKLAGTVLSNVKEFLYNADNYETLHKAAVKCSMKLYIKLLIIMKLYIKLLSNAVKVPNVFMKRHPKDILINNYNPTLMKSWQANMDVQFVSNAYACIQYLVAYITKEEREMGLLLQAVSKENSHQGIKEQMKKCGQAFTNSRTVSAQDSTYRFLQDYHIRECDY